MVRSHLKLCPPTCGDVFWDAVAIHEPHHLGRIVDLPQDAKDIEQITDELHRMFLFGPFLSPESYSFEHSCYS